MEILLLGLLLGQSHPGHLGLGVQAAGQSAIVHLGTQPHRVLGGDQALCAGFVRPRCTELSGYTTSGGCRHQAGAHRGIADGIEMGNVGPHVFVHDDRARNHLDAQLAQAQPRGIGQTSCRQDHVGDDLAFAPRQHHRQGTILLLADRLHGGVSVEGHPGVVEQLSQPLGDLVVGVGQQARAARDHGNPAAQQAKELRQFQVRRTAGQDRDTRRDLAQFERLFRADHAGQIKPPRRSTQLRLGARARQPCGDRARGNEDVARPDRSLANLDRVL